MFDLTVAALVLGVLDLGLTSGLKSLMIPLVLMFGTTVQLIANIMDFKRKNIFGATVSGIYTMTMYSMTLTILITKFGGEESFVITHYVYGFIQY